MRPALPIVLLLSLTACDAGQSNGNAAAVPSEPQGDATGAQIPEPTTDECGADRLGRYLNVLPTETIKAEIADRVEHDRIRYIAPGDMVTQDLRPDRLNVETGVDGRIKLFRCG